MGTILNDDNPVLSAIAICPKCHAGGRIGNLQVNPDESVDCENCGKFTRSEFASCRSELAQAQTKNAA